MSGKSIGKVPEMKRLDRRQALRISLVALQWVSLTVAMGALLVRTDDSIEGLLGGQIDLSYMFFAGFAAGLFLGISVPIARVLYPLTFLMCLGAAVIYVSLLFSPTWVDITVRTGALENFATTRGLFFGGLMLVPASLGALFGHLGSGILGRHGEILRPHDDESREAPSWTERRGN